MFAALFKTECRQILKSLVYSIYVIIFVLFLTSQMGDSEWVDAVQKPQPGQEYYGVKVTTDETQIMEQTLASYMQEVYHNFFATYPFGFYKGVKLNEKELARAKQILEECTGVGFETLEEEMYAHYEKYDQSTFEGAMEAQTSYRIPVKEGLRYEEFQQKMEEVCRLVGKGSSYEKESYANSSYVQKTYEDALADFEALCGTDKVTGAYMRIFCDYAGIVLAILPIFVGVSGALRDKRAKAEQVIFSKSASGAAVLVSRYLATLLLVFLPVVITAFFVQQPYLYKAGTLGVSGDGLAFLKYTFVWLLPEIMIVLALSLLITEVTGTIFAVFVQAFWGIGSLFGASTLVGNFGFRLVVRWNEIGGSTEFAAQKDALLINRGYYAGLAVLCLILSVLVYEWRRKKGGRVYGKIRGADR